MKVETLILQAAVDAACAAAGRWESVGGVAGPLMRRYQNWRARALARVEGELDRLATFLGAEPQTYAPKGGWIEAYASKGEAQRRWANAYTRFVEASDLWSVPLLEPYYDSRRDGAFAAVWAADDAGDIDAYEQAVDEFSQKARAFARKLDRSWR